MKSSASSRPALAGILAGVMVLLTACGASESSSSASEADKAVTKAVSQASAAETAAVPETTAPAETPAVTEAVTAAEATDTETTALPEPEEDLFTDEQMTDLIIQQEEQLRAAAGGDRDGYLSLIKPKLIFKVMMGSAGKTMDAEEVAGRISEEEETYFKANKLIFSDKKIIKVSDPKLEKAEDDLQPETAVAYYMTFTAEADGETIPMEGFVVDLGKGTMSVSLPSKGTMP